MVKESEITRKESCSVCHWHGQILAVIEDGFVNWACPRRIDAHSRLITTRALSEAAIEDVSITVEGN
jgi:hypothetical protein